MQKEIILQTAEVHFFAKKFRDVKLDNIAIALDIKKPSLYYYFIDKKDLFVQTVKYSMEKYVNQLKDIVSRWDLDEFIQWFLIYPSEQKNLFAISFQKGYLIDDTVKNLILLWKSKVNDMVHQLLSAHGVPNVKIYLVQNLLDKLAYDNCIDGYCLMFSIEEIKKEIKLFMWK